MLTAKKFVSIITICFLITLFSSLQLWSKETSNTTPPDQQKSETKKEQATTQNQPQISIDSATFDAGEAYEGDMLSHTFTVKNTGSAPLIIEKVKPG